MSSYTTHGSPYDKWTSLACTMNDGAATALQRYVDAFYGGRHPTSPEGFAISPHVAKSETWLEVRADDREFARKLEDCLDMPFVSDAELRSRGLSGADIPSFNFAPAVGFYQKSIEFEGSKPKPKT